MEWAMADAIVLEEIQAAEKGVAEAEIELERLMHDLQVAPRAEKTTISAVLENAFQKVRDAREHLGKVGILLRGADDRGADRGAVSTTARRAQDL